MAGKRGPSYPAFGLGEAIQRARELYQQDGRAQTTPGVAVGAWGYRSLNGASLRVLSALKQFGFLETSDDYVRLTDRALAIIVEPPGSPDYVEAIRESVRAPAAFAALLQEYPENMPSDGALKAYLVRRLGYGESAAENLVLSFRETIELEKESVGSYITESPERTRPDREQQPRAGAFEQRRPQAEAPSRGPGGRGVQIGWPLADGSVAVMSVERRLNLQDVEMLEGYLKTLKDALKAAPSPSAAPSEPVPQGAVS